MPGDGDESGRLRLVALAVGDRRQVTGQLVDRHRVEVEALGAAPDGVEELVGLGGGEDEDDVVGRLLERLEEGVARCLGEHVRLVEDRKSTRLNSSHVKSSYAVFCLEKK